MSSQQSALETYSEPAEVRRAKLSGVGAIYGQRTRAPSVRVESNICLHCEADIPSAIARACGDNHGRVRRCNQCTSHESTTVAQQRAVAPGKRVDE